MDPSLGIRLIVDTLFSSLSSLAVASSSQHYPHHHQQQEEQQLIKRGQQLEYQNFISSMALFMIGTPVAAARVKYRLRGWGEEDESGPTYIKRLSMSLIDIGCHPMSWPLY